VRGWSWGLWFSQCTSVPGCFKINIPNSQISALSVSLADTSRENWVRGARDIGRRRCAGLPQPAGYPPFGRTPPSRSWGPWPFRGLHAVLDGQAV